MLTKTTVALTTALVLGIASSAMAQSKEGDQRGGYRELGSGGFAQQGITTCSTPTPQRRARRPTLSPTILPR
jgi:hypothetical protein